MLDQERAGTKKNMLNDLETKNDIEENRKAVKYLLAKQPKEPKPTEDQMRAMFRQGRYKELHPILKIRFKTNPI